VSTIIGPDVLREASTRSLRAGFDKRAPPRGGSGARFFLSHTIFREMYLLIVVPKIESAGYAKALAAGS